MINSVTVINHLGESLDLELRDPWKTGLAVMSIDGLHPATANINSTELSTMDGSVFNSSRITNRNIIIQLIVLENLTVEQARHIIYKYFPVKHKVRFEVHTDERDVYTEGYIESNKVDIFSQQETATISMICPDPYFYSTRDVVTALNDITGGFEFPFSNPVGTESLKFGEISVLGPRDIIYEGEYPIGIDIEIHATGNVGNLRIYNTRTDQEILLDNSKIETKTGSGIISGDTIRICTIQGRKSVKLYRSGVEHNILSCVSRDTGWIRLEPGDNVIVYTGTGVQNAQIYVTNKIVYEGV